MIAILGIFSLSIMVMVRRFSSTMQREWIESGQVIQFMTVMIIIIAILALGLAGKLPEQSLGTLLGAIGGYVLAQGVGRAAAKKGEQRAQAAQQDVPPPAPGPSPQTPVEKP